MSIYFLLCVYRVNHINPRRRDVVPKKDSSIITQKLNNSCGNDQ